MATAEPAKGQSSPRPTRATDPSSGLEYEAIREQLGHVLASPEFHATDKMRDFLRFVVEEKLAGRSYRIKGYTVAVEVFARSEDFDPTHDPVVRIQAGRLRRALERYYLVAGIQDPVLIDIPKGGYVPRFTARPTQPASVRTLSTAPSKDELPLTDEPRIAVLPFENLTGNDRQQFLAVGLTEELVTELTRFQDIAVISCQHAQWPPGHPSIPVEVARQVGARFVLRGAVRRDADMVKVSAQLTDSTDGRQVWAESSSHLPNASEYIATQEQIAQSVVAAIATEYGIIARRLSAEARKKTPAELGTYEAILRYYNHQIVPTSESAARCFSALQGAAEREPEYGPVWSALATLHCQMYLFDVSGFENALETGLAFSRKGVVLEPSSQLAHLILAYASLLADDSKSFHDEARTTLELNPNSPYAVGAIGYCHILRGELDPGLPLLDRAIAMNPCHPKWFHAGHVIDHLLRRDYEYALKETRKHLPFIDFWDDVMLTAMLGKLGRADEAGPYIERITAQKPEFPGRARELFRRSLKIDPLIDDLIEGLHTAGMHISSR